MARVASRSGVEEDGRSTAAAPDWLRPPFLDDGEGERVVVPSGRAWFTSKAPSASHGFALGAAARTLTQT